jgi:hypothetical protein
MGFPVYAITVMTSLGWVMLMFFLPIGMWAYAFDYVGAYVKRPQPMKKEDFDNAKRELALYI